MMTDRRESLSFWVDLNSESSANLAGTIFQAAPSLFQSNKVSRSKSDSSLIISSSKQCNYEDKSTEHISLSEKKHTRSDMNLMKCTKMIAFDSLLTDSDPVNDMNAVDSTQSSSNPTLQKSSYQVQSSTSSSPVQTIQLQKQNFDKPKKRTRKRVLPPDSNRQQSDQSDSSETTEPSTVISLRSKSRSKDSKKSEMRRSSELDNDESDVFFDTSDDDDGIYRVVTRNEKECKDRLGRSVECPDYPASISERSSSPVTGILSDSPSRQAIFMSDDQFKESSVKQCQRSDSDVPSPVSVTIFAVNIAFIRDRLEESGSEDETSGHGINDAPKRSGSAMKLWSKWSSCSEDRTTYEDICIERSHQNISYSQDMQQLMQSELFDVDNRNEVVSESDSENDKLMVTLLSFDVEGVEASSQQLRNDIINDRFSESSPSLLSISTNRTPVASLVSSPVTSCTSIVETPKQENEMYINEKFFDVCTLSRQMECEEELSKQSQETDESSTIDSNNDDKIEDNIHEDNQNMSEDHVRARIASLDFDEDESLISRGSAASHRDVQLEMTSGRKSVDSTQKGKEDEMLLIDLNGLSFGGDGESEPIRGNIGESCDHSRGSNEFHGNSHANREDSAGSGEGFQAIVAQQKSPQAEQNDQNSSQLDQNDQKNRSQLRTPTKTQHIKEYFSQKKCYRRNSLPAKDVLSQFNEQFEESDSWLRESDVELSESEPNEGNLNLKDSQQSERIALTRSVRLSKHAIAKYGVDEGYTLSDIEAEETKTQKNSFDENEEELRKNTGQSERSVDNLNKVIRDRSSRTENGDYNRDGADKEQKKETEQKNEKLEVITDNDGSNDNSCDSSIEESARFDGSEQAEKNSNEMVGESDEISNQSCSFSCRKRKNRSAINHLYGLLARTDDDREDGTQDEQVLRVTLLDGHPYSIDMADPQSSQTSQPSASLKSRASSSTSISSSSLSKSQILVQSSANANSSKSPFIDALRRDSLLKYKSDLKKSFQHQNSIDGGVRSDFTDERNKLSDEEEAICCLKKIETCRCVNTAVGDTPQEHQVFIRLQPDGKEEEKFHGFYEFWILHFWNVAI
ncbi:unnamed protein product [Anisakis simplex]|uniref:Dentin sialophosphoprotein-like n=1 Tax=Anisakis simplex TaxID=6269 RepID=A0A0M3K3E3_ANISI|nr:unnamed protein product [Anisakis simplex]